MRYMLYESNENMVALEKEITYLKNYIELQRLRFKNQAFVFLDVTGDCSNCEIMPLLLISFVENAFKHGVATDEQHPISISIHVEDNELHFTVMNKKNSQNKDQTGGIGLTNVKRRLDLMYRGKYDLSIEDGPSLYSLELHLKLS